eukprot:1678339-Rhodomonas_salina.1
MKSSEEQCPVEARRGLHVTVTDCEFVLLFGGRVKSRMQGVKDDVPLWLEEGLAHLNTVDWLLQVPDQMPSTAFPGLFVPDRVCFPFISHLHTVEWPLQERGSNGLYWGWADEATNGGDARAEGAVQAQRCV